MLAQRRLTAGEILLIVGILRLHVRRQCLRWCVMGELLVTMPRPLSGRSPAGA